MKKRSTSGELQDLIKQLTTIRKEHVRALDEIENTFRMFGLERLLKDGAKRGGKKAAAVKTAAPATTGKKKAGKAKKAAAPAAAAPKAGKKGKAAKAAKATKAPKAAKATKAPKAAKATKAPKTTKAPKASKAAGKRRGSFEITGDELILRFVKDKGGATTEQIRKHWEASSRGGKSDNNLTNLVKSGKLLRNKDPNGPGSLYTVGSAASAAAAPTTPTA